MREWKVLHVDVGEAEEEINRVEREGYDVQSATVDTITGRIVVLAAAQRGGFCALVGCEKRTEGRASYCSAAHKQAAHRMRHGAGRGAAKKRNAARFS